MARRRKVTRSLRALLVMALPVGALAGVGGALAVTGTAGAVGTTLYVSTTGTDSGTCTTVGTACKTLGYALSVATAGDTIQLAVGTYKEATDPTKTSNTVTQATLTIEGTAVTGTAATPAKTIVTAAGETYGLLVLASHVTVTDLTVQYARHAGILATLGTPGTVTNETISTNKIVTNDRSATTATVAKTTATACKTPVTGTPTPTALGMGLHLLSVATSTIHGNVIEHNWGGIYLTDELGPNHGNTVTTNTVSTNTGACGITLASHNTKAVYHTGTTTGKPDPTAGGVYTNLITHNVADNNVDGAGLLAAGPFPGTGVYHNTFTKNTAEGDGLAGMTIHTHAPLEDMNTNVIETNVFANDALHAGPAGGPGTSTAGVTQKVGVLIFGGVTPVTGTVITGNTVSTVFYGIWLSHGESPFTAVSTNKITVTAGGTAVFSEPTPGAGYWMLSSNGGTFSFGGLSYHGSIPGNGVSVSNAAAVTSTPDGGGYWIVTANGTVDAFGDAVSYGTLPALHVTVSNIVGIAATVTGGGYWLVGSDGGVFAFGTATFDGSMGGKPLNKPIVGIATTPTGGGYWMDASDGGIFAFGTATFEGSMGGKPLNQPVVGMTATTTGSGYWLVAADGGIFAFGTATFEGSEGGKPLNQPIVGMTAAATGVGYLLVAKDGGIFAFGSATFQGSLPGVGVTTASVVGVATNP